MAGEQQVGKGAGRGGAAGLLLPLLALAPLVYLVWPSLLVLAPLMAPTLAAAVADRSRGRHLAYTVGLLNLACALSPLLRLWAEGHDRATALALVADPGNWLVAYGGAGLAWLIYLAMPPLAAAYYANRTQDRLAVLRKRRERLEKTWGPEVAEGPAD